MTTMFTHPQFGNQALHARALRASLIRSAILGQRQRDAQRVGLAAAYEAAVARRAPQPMTGDARIARLPAAHLPDAILRAGVIAADTPVRWVGGSPQWGEGVLLDPIPAGTTVEVTSPPRGRDPGSVTLVYPEGTFGREGWHPDDEEVVAAWQRATLIAPSPEGANNEAVDALTDEEHRVLDRLDAWLASEGVSRVFGDASACPAVAALT